MPLCDHYACRCAMAADLAARGLTVEAVALHKNNVRVECKISDPRAVRRSLSCVGTACNGLFDFVRASGDVVCTCGLPYYDHPHCVNSAVPISPTFAGRPDYVLRVVCDGKHVKL